MKMTLTPLFLEIGNDREQAVGLGEGQAGCRLVEDDETASMDSALAISTSCLGDTLRPVRPD